MLHISFRKFTYTTHLQASQTNSRVPTNSNCFWVNPTALSLSLSLCVYLSVPSTSLASQLGEICFWILVGFDSGLGKIQYDWLLDFTVIIGYWDLG